MSRTRPALPVGVSTGIAVEVPVPARRPGAVRPGPDARKPRLAMILGLAAWVVAVYALSATPTVQAIALPLAPQASVIAAAPTATLVPSPQATPPPAKPQASLIPWVDSEWLIIVHRGQQQMVLYRGGQEQKTYTVSTGKPETITPLGWWKIVEKYPVDPPGIYGTRWLGWQRWNPRSGRYEWYKESPPFGIHGTNEPEKIGTAVSSGCIRLPNRDVEEVYSLIPVGTYVLVVE